LQETPAILNTPALGTLDHYGRVSSCFGSLRRLEAGGADEMVCDGLGGRRQAATCLVEGLLCHPQGCLEGLTRDDQAFCRRQEAEGLAGENGHHKPGCYARALGGPGGTDAEGADPDASGDRQCEDGMRRAVSSGVMNGDVSGGTEQCHANREGSGLQGRHRRMPFASASWRIASSMTSPMCMPSCSVSASSNASV
jgi:hypothetical protein